MADYSRNGLYLAEIEPGGPRGMDQAKGDFYVCFFFSSYVYNLNNSIHQAS